MIQFHIFESSPRVQCMQWKLFILKTWQRFYWKCCTFCHLSCFVFSKWEMNETLFSNSVTMICRTVLKSLAITADAHFKLKNYEANRIKLQKTRPMLNFWELLLPSSKIYTSIILLCDIKLLLHLENIWIFECEDYIGL